MNILHEPSSEFELICLISDLFDLSDHLVGIIPALLDFLEILFRFGSHISKGHPNEECRHGACDASESMAKRLGITFAESVACVERGVPLGRLSKPDEFGAMMAFLASPEANYISGGVFAVDGGKLKAI